MNDLMNIDNDLPTRSDENLTNIVLYSHQIYDKKTNQITLTRNTIHKGFTKI